jgi:signal transduction histidine kinase
MIVEQSGRLARILDEVLLTQQLDSGGLRIEQTSFDATAAAERVVEQSRGWRATRPVRLAAAGALEVEGDPGLFEQALVNLLDNAVKYSPADGEIRVVVERRGGSARVTVADDGPGVAPDDRERIFEKFFRADPAQLSGTTGTGLGLYITRELMRRMRGRVGLEPADAGALFFVELPLTAREP